MLLFLGPNEHFYVVGTDPTTPYISNMAQQGNSIKDYYIRLERMHVNVMNMLTALNQSLLTNSSEITVTVADTDDVESTIRIPSFLYLENKLEELSNNFGTLFNMPKSGEAWFTSQNGSSSNTYRMNMVRTNTAMPEPDLTQSTGKTSIKTNNILKDLVSPKTFIRYNINNLFDGIGTQSVEMKKFIFFNEGLFDTLSSMKIDSYRELEEKLFGYKVGIDYDVYESELKLPVRQDTVTSEFKILEVMKDFYTQSSSNTDLFIDLKVDTLQYFDTEDSSIVYYINKGDKLVYKDTNVEFEVYNITELSDGTSVLTLKETNGHAKIVSIQDDISSILYIINNTYKKYHYIDVPLEENPKICICLAVVYNGIRSHWSAPEFLDLSVIQMTDMAGNLLKDENGNVLSYIDYYNKYCNNIGDLIAGISSAAYPQLSNFTPAQLAKLQSSDIADLHLSVNETLSPETVKVVPINKHLTDDATNEEMVKLHDQKNELSAKLATLQSNIDATNNKIINTDFSQDTSTSQQTLQTQLTEYYTERTLLTKQFNSLVDTLNAKIAALNAVQDKVKYRLRGITSVDGLENEIKSIGASDKVELIGMEVYYKYKSVNKDTTTLTVINSDTFSEWNIQRPCQRDRFLLFSSDNSSFVTEYEDYNTASNTPKWNQIDIPIKNGEDVVLKIRYIYNIGQPFITLYTPWSDEQTFTFPDEYKEDIKVSTIIDQNADDSISARFSQKLINDGYDTHISDKITSADNTFFHSPDHIYSGFNTSENNLLSLKEKLQLMMDDINKYKEILDDKLKAKYTVSINVDGNDMPVSPGVKNKVNIYNTDDVSTKYIKKTININIKNTSNNNVRLYSLFPGNVSVPLMYSDVNAEYNKKIFNFERVPIQVGKKLSPQYLGQWIYFRQNNPTVGTDIYLNEVSQNKEDLKAVQSDGTIIEPTFILSRKDYMAKNNKQVLLPYRFRLSNSLNSFDTLITVCSALTKMKRFMGVFGDNIMSDHTSLKEEEE